MDMIKRGIRSVLAVIGLIIMIPVTLALALFTFLGVIFAGLAMTFSLRQMAPASAGQGRNTSAKTNRSGTIEAHKTADGRYEV